MYRLTQQQQQQQQPRKQDAVTKELQEVFLSSGPPSTRKDDDDEDDPSPVVLLLTRHVSAPNLSPTAKSNQICFADGNGGDATENSRFTRKSLTRFRRRPKTPSSVEESRHESAPSRRSLAWKRTSRSIDNHKNGNDYSDTEDQASIVSWKSAPLSSRGTTATSTTTTTTTTTSKTTTTRSTRTEGVASRRSSITSETDVPDHTGNQPVRRSRLVRFRSLRSTIPSSWRNKKKASHDQVVADFFDVQSLHSEPDLTATSRRRLFGGQKASTSRTGDAESVSLGKSSQSQYFRRAKRGRRRQPTPFASSDDNGDNDDDCADNLSIESDFFPAPVAARSFELDAVVSGMTSTYWPARPRTAHSPKESHDDIEKPQQNRSVFARLFPGSRRNRKTTLSDTDKNVLPSTLNDFPTTRTFGIDNNNNNNNDDDDDLDAELAQINDTTTISFPYRSTSAMALFDRWSPIPVDPTHMMMLPGTPPPAPPRRVRSLDASGAKNDDSNNNNNGNDESDDPSESSDDDRMQAVSLGLVGRIGSPRHIDGGEHRFGPLAKEESKRDDYGGNKKDKTWRSSLEGDNHSDGDDSSILSMLSSLLIAWAGDGTNHRGMDDSDDLQDQSGQSPIQLSSGRILRSCLKKPALARTNHNNSVTFSVVQVREFERTVGDNPSCSTGPPVGLGWAYHDATPDVAVEDHAQLPKRTKRQFHLPPAKRTTLLTEEWSVSEQDIRQARREATYIQYCREKTAFTGGRRDSSGKALRKHDPATLAEPEVLERHQQQQQQVQEQQQQQHATLPRRPGPDQTATTQPTRFRRCNSLEDYGPSATEAAVSIRRSVSLACRSMDDDGTCSRSTNHSRFDIGDAATTTTTSTMPAPPRRKPSGQLLEV